MIPKLISGSEHKIQDFPLVIDYQMQVESEEPPHGALSTSGQPFKGLVNQYPLVTAYTKQGRIHETDTGTCAQQNLFDEEGPVETGLLFQFYKAVVRYTVRKKMGQMFADIFLVIMLETSESSGMEQDKDNHYFRITYVVRFVPVTSCIFNHIFFLLQRKFLAESIRQTIIVSYIELT